MFVIIISMNFTLKREKINGIEKRNCIEGVRWILEGKCCNNFSMGLFIC